MKKMAFALLSLAFACVAVPSMAASLVFDTFTYPNGPLVPNGGWANFSGANTDIQVASGHARIVPANANDDHILFAAQSTTTRTYACFDVTVEAFAGNAKPVYFAMLKDAGTSIFVSRVYVLPVNGGWTLGISHSSTSTSVGVTPWGATLSSGVTYHVVINYDPVAKTSTLWVNPINELSTSVTDTNAAIAAVGVAGFGLRQSASASTFPASPGYTGTTDVNVQVDNLGVGNTFDDACNIPTAATPTTWGGIKGLYR
jgi:hypothetical protein